MTRLRRIGGLGGMGPEATILLQRKLLAAVKADDDSGHIPLLIDMNPQVPSRIEHLVHGRGPSPAPVLVDMAVGLQKAGAEALVMPCNTAHYYVSDITAAVSIPLLNMVEMSIEIMAHAAPQGANIGMLASPAVQKSGLFDKALVQKGLKALWPESGAKMLQAIQSIKKNGRNKEARESLFKASSGLARQGAHFQFVACSEFSLIADSTAQDAEVLDTLDILVEAIKAFSFSNYTTMEKI